MLPGFIRYRLQLGFRCSVRRLAVIAVCIPRRVRQAADKAFFTVYLDRMAAFTAANGYNVIQSYAVIRNVVGIRFAGFYQYIVIPADACTLGVDGIYRVAVFCFIILRYRCNICTCRYFRLGCRNGCIRRNARNRCRFPVNRISIAVYVGHRNRAVVRNSIFRRIDMHFNAFGEVFNLCRPRNRNITQVNISQTGRTDGILQAVARIFVLRYRNMVAAFYGRMLPGFIRYRLQLGFRCSVRRLAVIAVCIPRRVRQAADKAFFTVYLNRVAAFAAADRDYIIQLDIVVRDIFRFVCPRGDIKVVIGTNRCLCRRNNIIIVDINVISCGIRLTTAEFIILTVNINTGQRISRISVNGCTIIIYFTYDFRSGIYGKGASIICKFDTDIFSIISVLARNFNTARYHRSTRRVALFIKCTIGL